MSRPTWEHRREPHACRLRGCHPLWRAVPGTFTYTCGFSLPGLSDTRPVGSRYPGDTTLSGFTVSSGLGCSLFARRYWGNRGCFLFLRVLRCFSSPRSPRTPMDSAHDDPPYGGPGCPIRRSPPQSLFAAKRGLSQLTTSFIASLCQGIPTCALSSLIVTFESIPVVRTVRSRLDDARGCGM